MSKKDPSKEYVIPPIPKALQPLAEVVPGGDTISGITERAGQKSAMLAAQRVLHEMDHQPLTEIVKMLKDAEDLPPRIRAEINLKLMEYVYPKLKAVSVEVNDNTENPVSQALNEMNRKSIGFEFKGSNKVIEEILDDE